jgi:hypothetical protein
MARRRLETATRGQAGARIVNPDKLRHLGPVADLGTVLRQRT